MKAERFVLTLSVLIVPIAALFSILATVPVPAALGQSTANGT